MAWRYPEPHEYNHLAERLLPVETLAGRWVYTVDSKGIVWAVPIVEAGKRLPKRKKLGKLDDIDESKYLYYVLDGWAVRVSRARYREIGMTKKPPDPSL